MARNGILVDTGKCDGCRSCVVGCKNWHDLPAGTPGRIRLMDITTGHYPEVSRWLFPIMCMQCAFPPCVAVCRFQACHVGEDGIVRVAREKCVGCNLCVLTCPYDARVPTEDGTIADGCDFCADRTAAGDLPYCVETCPSGALIFGDLDDPKSEISRILARGEAGPLKKSFKTRPRVFYAHLPLPISDRPDPRREW